VVPSLPAEAVSALVAHAGRVISRHGVAGTARLAARRYAPVRRRALVFVWYALDLGGERPRRALGDGLVLRQGGEDDMWLLDQLPADQEVRTMTPWFVSEHLARGGDLWLVQEGGRAAFRCWVHRERLPMAEARGRGVDLPDDVVVLEDSISSPLFRGRGIAPAAWAGLADRYAAEGRRWMYTKVNEDNGPSRRAVEKAGFRDVARMQVVRRDVRTRIRVVTGDGAPEHRWLARFERG
jgi:RimJ/RimL family protein N-acetyltransferase